MLRFLVAPLLSAALLGCASSSREPNPNLTLLKAENVAWHDSGAYDRAFARAADPARRTLEGYLRGVTPQNFAVVFDIDETLLSNWPYLSAGQFAISAETFAAWTIREHGIALTPMREVYAKAHAYQIPIFLVTGRDESLRAATQRDLEEAGYWGWSGLYMKPSSYRDPSIIPFKSGVRKMLTEHGYQIILNVGDQDSDLAGGYARHRFKLPNPFYYLP
ncbi:MAG TPA: HAD family acid phosphatase [Chthoniobacterales bacterium]